MRIEIVAAFIAALAVPGAVSAHHSAAQFDFGQTVRVEGRVKELKVENPHTSLVLEVKDEKGEREIEYEAHSRNNIFRRGWRPDMVKVGDQISIDIAPPRSGGDGGYVKTFILADGSEF